MATQRFKLAINQAAFPFVYANASSGALQPGLDPSSRLPFSFMGDAESADYNTIQLQYCENVVPTAAGLASAKYLSVISGPGTGEDFDRMILLKSENNVSYIFGVANGVGYTWSPTTTTWLKTYTFSSYSVSDLISTIYVNGKSYLLFEKLAMVVFNPLTGYFEPAVPRFPEGAPITSILCGCGASNYAVVATDSEIIWSTLSDPTDFQDVDQGAGRSTPVDLKGTIRALLPISGGFIIYTTKNAVAAFFTNKASGPFLFKEVPGSGGVANSEQVTGDGNSNYHYTYGNSGIQMVNMQKAESVLPAAADFLAGNAYSYWDHTTKTMQQSNGTATRTKIQFLLNRYVFCSYAYDDTNFQFCLVYDTILRRWGNLRVSHRDINIIPNLTSVGSVASPLMILEMILTIDDYIVPIDELNKLGTGEITALDILHWRDNIGFMDVDGNIVKLQVEEGTNFGLYSGNSVAVLGHVKYSRSKTLTLQDVSVSRAFETVIEPVSLHVLVAEAAGGQKRDATYQAVRYFNDGEMMRFRKRVTGDNFDIALVGSFSLSTVVVETTSHGSR